MARDRTEAERLFLQNLPTIEHILGLLSRRYAMGRDDAADFASWAKLRLIENDYSAIREFRGDATIAGYLRVVLAMQLRDYRAKEWGRWRPSAEARRAGPLAVRLETLVYRDGLSLREAGELLRTAGETTLSDAELSSILSALPRRKPLRPRSVGEDSMTNVPAREAADAPLEKEAEDSAWAAARQLLVEAIAALPPEDQVILKLRFWNAMNVADIARATDTPQKPLYRRLDRMLKALRQQLEAKGVSKSVVAKLIGRIED